MKIASSSLLAAVAVVCASTFAAPTAFAQGTFTAAAPGDTCNPGTGAFDSVSCSKGTVTATLKAYGYTGATLSSTLATGFVQGRIGDFDANGFGAYTGTNESGTGSNHAFDSVTSGCGTGSGASGGTVALSTASSGCGGSVEALFLSFGTAKINLSNIGIGFNGGDADISVWAWTGAGDASVTATTAKGSTTTGGTTAAALTGWTLVSNHDFGAGIGSQNTSGTLYSSYFLITTYFGAASGGLTAGNDAFKLDSFTASACVGTLTGGTSGTAGTSGAGNGATCTPSTGTPEPGSLALAGVALAGAYGIRRRKVTVQQ